MAQITWRTVDAPNFSGSLEGYQIFSDLINRAGNTASSALGAYDESTSNGVNQRIRAAMLRYQDPAAMQQALSAGTLMQGADPRRVTTDTFNAMDRRTGDLTAQNTVLYNMNRTQEGDKQLAAAAPAVNSYLGAAALGDTAGMRKSLEQNASAFGGLRPDVYMKMLSDSAGTARSGVDMRNDFYGQSAANVASEILPQIGVPSDVEGLLAGNANYQALPAASKLAVQDRLRGAGYNPQGSTAPGIPGSAVGGASAAIGSAASTFNPFSLDPKQAARLQTVKFSPENDAAISSASAGDASKAAWLKAAVTIENRGKSAPDDNAVSNAKAAGAFQFIPSTGQQYGLKDEDRKDFTKSAGAAGKFYDDLYKQYNGNQLAMLAHYNGGGAAGAAVMAGKEPPSQETRDYLKMAQALGISNSDSATGLTEAAKRAQLTTAAQLDSAGASAALDAKMALSMRNLTGIATMIEKAGGKLDNPTDVATALATQFKDVPHSTLLGEVKRISKEYKIPHALAGEILLGGGMGDHLGSGFFGLRKAKDFLMGDKFLGTGYAPDEEFIRTTANALKTPMAQSQAAENKDIAAIGATIDAAKEKFTAAYEDHKQLLVRAAGNPALAKSVLSSEQRLGVATQRYENAILRQNSTPAARQQFSETNGNMPKVNSTPQQGVTGSWDDTSQPVATKVDGNASAAIAKAIAEEPAKDSPLRATWLRQQTEARKASEKSASEAERTAKEKAQVEQDKLAAARSKAYFAKTGRVMLAPQ